MKRTNKLLFMLGLSLVFAGAAQAWPRYSPRQIGKLGHAAEQNYAAGNTALANQQAALHNQAIRRYTTNRPNGFVAKQVGKGNQFIGTGLK